MQQRGRVQREHLAKVTFQIEELVKCFDYSKLWHIPLDLLPFFLENSPQVYVTDLTLTLKNDPCLFFFLQVQFCPSIPIAATCLKKKR